MLRVKLARDEHVEAVDEGKVNRRASAVLLDEPIMVSVQSVARREVGVSDHLGPVHLAIFQRGDLYFIQLGQVDALQLRHDFKFRREPAHTEFLLQQRVNSVKRPPRFAAGNDESFAVGAQREAVRAEFMGIDVPFQLPETRVIAQQDFPRLHWFGIGHNREPRAAHAFEVTLQFPGGVAFGWNRDRRDDDAIAAFALVYEGCGRQPGHARGECHHDC